MKLNRFLGTLIAYFLPLYSLGGIMRQNYIITIVLFLNLLTLLSAICPFTIETSNADSMVIHFNIPSYHFSPNANQPLLFDSEKSSYQTNDNEFPSFSTLLVLPEHKEGSVDYQILHTSQLPKNVIESSSIIPSPNGKISLSAPASMRGYHVSSLSFMPYLWDGQKQCSLITEAQIVIHYHYSDITESSRNIKTSAFQSLIETEALNAPEPDRSVQDRGSMLIIYRLTGTNQQFMNSLNELVLWKTKLGFDVHTWNMNTVNNSTTTVKQYIQNAYDTWDNPPEYILLLGEISGSFSVPCYGPVYPSVEEVASDHPYVMLDGNDYLADAFIGRLPFQTVIEFATIVKKIVKYESGFSNASGWYHKNLLVGDASQSGTSTVNTMDCIQDLMKEHNQNYDIYRISDEPFVSQTASVLNNGVAAYFYRGFYGTSGWTAENTYALTNTNKIPFVCAITCYSGRFEDIDDCFTESFLKAGSPTSVIGGIGAIGSSCATHTCTNNIITAGVAWGIYKEHLTTPGSALMRGKLALFQNYPSNPAQYVEIYSLANNLMGDPSVQLFIDDPVMLQAQFPSTINAAEQSVPVSVTNAENQPVEGVIITLVQNNALVGKGITDIFGRATINISSSEQSPIQITSSKQGCLPVLGTITIGTASNIFCTSVHAAPELTINRSSSISLTIHNNTTQTLNNCNLALRSQTNGISFTDSTATITTLAAGDSIVLANAYTVSIAANTSAEHANFYIQTLPINATCNFSLPICKPAVTLNSFAFADNSLYYLPGQNQLLSVTLQNQSTYSLTNCTIQLVTNSEDLQITNATTSVGNFASGATYSNTTQPFTVYTLPEAPKGSTILSSIQVLENGNLILSVPLQIGVTPASVTDPTGPDAYGYLCYDSQDVSYSEHPSYSWIEIDPSQSGNGTVLDMNDTNTDGGGVMKTIKLPFMVRYYGQSYNQISISSNGFVCLGTKDNNTWMNYHIPGPYVPSTMIAPFWDDLLTIDGHVSYSYKPEIHALVIEWNNLSNRFDLSHETFQLIIYDHQYQQTTLGDSPIRFQYKEVHNVDEGSYGGFYVNHGEYCTTGIMDNTATVGLEYTYSNHYPSSAAPLSANQALLFTASPYYPTIPLPIIQSVSVQDPSGNQDGFINPGETINLSLLIKNMGIPTATNVSVQLSLNDQYVQLANSNFTLNDCAHLLTCSPNTPATLTISDQCPNNHSIQLHCTIFYNNTHREEIITLPVFAPTIELVETSIINGDGNIVHGETASLRLVIKNTGSTSLTNASLSLLTSNAGIHVTPNSLTISNLVPGTTQAFLFSVSVPDSIANGTIIKNTLHIATSNNAQINIPFDLYIGVPTTMIADDFSDQTLLNWDITANVHLQNSSYINNSGSELCFEPNLYSSSYIISKAYYFPGVSSMSVSFKYEIIDENCSFCFCTVDNNLIATNLLWLANAPVNTVDSVYINIPVNDNTFANPVSRLGFVRSVSTNGAQVILDDVSLKFFYKPVTLVSGQVFCSNPAIDLSTVKIGNSQVQFPVNEDGTYNMELPEGTYALYAFIPDQGYSSADSTIVCLNHYHPTTGLNFDLVNFKNAPQNLRYTLTNNHLVLDWDSGTPRSFFKLLNYKLYKRISTSSSTVTIYTVTPHIEMNLGAHAVYYFYVKACYQDLFSNVIYSDSSNVIEVSYTANDDPNSDLPKVVQLYDPSPNPFNPSTTIRFDIAEATNHCSLHIYNVKGQLVRTLISGSKQPGRYSIVWDGKDNSNNNTCSGVYFMRLETGNKTITRKALLLK